MNLATKSHFVKQCLPSEEPQLTEGKNILTRMIIAVHVVYHTVEEHIHWFGQLTSCMPGILVKLDASCKEPQEYPEMVLLSIVHVYLCAYIHKTSMKNIFKKCIGM